MNTTNQIEPTGLDAFSASLQRSFEHAYEALMRLSLSLDQALGAEVTTGLAVILGLVSLALALLPVYAAWRQPSAMVVTPQSEPDVPRNALGEEIVQMHPERLQQLYGVPEAKPVEPVEPPPQAVSAVNDLPLGLIADLSDELAKQQQIVDKLTLLTAQQQHNIEMLVAQLKAQSSAFLLQGERLLRLEFLATQQSAVPEAEATSCEETQRLSTFDQAIELAGQGASVEALMAQCGLSVSEARLVVLVHGKTT